MNIKKIYRNTDVINGSKDLELLCQFKKFPIFMGTTNHKIKKDKFFNMKWFISRSSGMIQLNPLIPLKVLYENSHDSGDVGKLWDLHHRSFANFVIKANPRKVLEIGAGHGKLYENISKIKKINWTIIEPNPEIKKNKNLTIIKGYFNKNSKFKKKFDTYIHSHTFEHIYDPNEFMEAININLPIGGKLIFSIPNLEVMLKKKYTNALNFEHTFFLTDKFVRYFLKKNGFKMIKKEKFRKEHSLFYSCIKVRDINKKLKFKKSTYIKYKKIFLDYINFHKKLIKYLNNKLLESNKQIFLFGAHIFSQYLINFGLKTKKIIYILDNDKKKQNKRLYGTNLFVRSPKILQSYKSPLIILKAAVYSKEIKEDIVKNINNNAKFI